MLTHGTDAGLYLVQTKVDILWLSFAPEAEEIQLKKMLKQKYELLECRPEELSLYDKLEPGIIFFDFNEPSDLGLRIIQKFKTSLPQIPMLLLTHHMTRELAIWALRSRIWDAIEKPLHPVEMQRVVDSVGKLFVLKAENRESRKQAMEHNTPFNNKVENERTKNTKERLKPALEKIDREYSGRLCESELAESCQMSIHHFSRLFRRVMGVTLQEYIVNYRLKEAASLMLASDSQIAAIGYSVGFNDASYFSRAFKKYFGVTPSQYKRRRGDLSEFKSVS